MIAVIVASLLVPTTVQASEADLAACMERVAHAERVIDACGLALEKEHEYSQQLERHSRRLQESLRAAHDELDKQDRWYKQAEIVGPISLALGILVGVIVASER